VQLATHDAMTSDLRVDANLAEVFGRIQKTLTVDSPSSSVETFIDFPPYGQLWDQIAKAAWQADQPALAEVRKLRAVQDPVWPADKTNRGYLNAMRDVANHVADAAVYQHFQGDDAGAVETVIDLLHVEELLDLKSETVAVRPMVGIGIRAMAANRLEIIAAGAKYSTDPRDLKAMQVSTARQLITQLLNQRDPKALAATFNDPGIVDDLKDLSKSKFIETAYRGNTEQSFAAVSLASHLFQLDRNRWPNTMDELVPAYLPVVSIDPWGDGKQTIGYVLIKGGLPDGGDRPLVFSRCESRDGLFVRIDQPMYSFYNGDGSNLPYPQQKRGGQFRDITRWAPPPAEIKKLMLGRWRGKQKTPEAPVAVIDADRVHLTEDGSEETWRYTIDPTHFPAWIDLTDDNKFTQKGIVRERAGELHIVLNDTGGERPVSFDRSIQNRECRFLILEREDGTKRPTTQPLR
jgi:hypothetical protein